LRATARSAAPERSCGASAPNSRLACQLPMSEDLAGVVLRLPDRQI
jgi:ferredoxin